MTVESVQSLQKSGNMRQLLSTSGENDAVFVTIIVGTVFNFIGSIVVLIVLHLATNKLEVPYTARLLKLVVICSVCMSFVMMLTPNGYDSNTPDLGTSKQCELQAAFFTFFSSARWLFTGMMFLSECRKVVSDTWPTKQYRGHSAIGWGLSAIIGGGGLVASVAGSTVYGWQWEGRCGIKYDHTSGLM